MNRYRVKRHYKNYQKHLCLYPIQLAIQTVLLSKRLQVGLRVRGHRG